MTPKDLHPLTMEDIDINPPHSRGTERLERRGLSVPCLDVPIYGSPGQRTEAGPY